MQKKLIYLKILKMLKDASRECHSRKPQPTPDIKMKRKKTKHNACKINKQLYEKHIDQFPKPELFVYLLKSEKICLRLE